MNKRAMSIALAATLLGVGLLFLYLKRFERDASGGPPVTLLVAIKPIEPGALVTESMLATRNTPLAYVENRAVRSSEEARVLGLRVSTRVEPGQTLMWTDLAIAADDRRDLSSLVQPGMRAVTVRAKNGGSDRANELIRPGDRVDVIVTTGERDHESTVVLMQNVLVLAVGLDTGNDSTDKRANGVRDSLLTLSLSVHDAQLEAMAAEKGRISVALRNPDDVRVVEGLTQLTPSALVDARGPHAGALAALGAPAPPAAPVKLERTEVQRGGRR